MRHLHFSVTEKQTYPVCFLVPSIRSDEIQKAYLEPYALDPEDVLVLDLHMAPGKKKTSMTEVKAYISEQLMPAITDTGVEYIVVADAEYFKAFTKTTKVDSNLGYVLPSEFGPQKVIYVPNYRTIFYDPEKVTARIAQGINALTDHRSGKYEKPGNGVIQFEAYPQTLTEIREHLQVLLDMNVPLTIDIEGFGLKHHTAGIGTISFAWNQHEGIAFAVDYEPIPGATKAPFGRQVHNEPVRELLRAFFEAYTQKAIYHHISYDVYVLIYQLYMTDILDTQGLLRGMYILFSNWDCTKLITYLATNSCAGNQLGLKVQAQEFAGNYAMGEDIHDITRIPLDKLLRYNLVDSLSTWFVYDKHWETVIADNQVGIYETIFKPAILDIVQMQLTGLPINMARVQEVKAILVAEELAAETIIRNSPLVQQFTDDLRWNHVCKRNSEMKIKIITMADAEVAKVVFNPRSGPQVQDLIYRVLGMPILGYTDSGKPSTDGDTLKALVNHTDEPEILIFLNALLDLSAVKGILSTFIPALENAISGPDGWHYLCGSFNLGGTLSGRLSSSEPNLQNIPMGAEGEKTKKGVYGKLIKSCIEAPPGWVFAGLDFNALEDRISALTTKDPNKLAVYLDGYDGHSLRAYAYYGDQMPDIDPTSVKSINSIAKLYPNLRSESKPPTFALTYQGTFATLMTNCGFSLELARKVEASYHKLYAVSDAWVAARLDQACRDGYVTAAFGLRVRTPLLAQVIRGTRKTPHEAEAEGRSAGNALGQSWCLLNSRASSEFMGKVRAGEHRLSIRPCAQIHDAAYFLLRDDSRVVAYTNEHLVKAVQWQDDPAIWHDEVKLGGELSLFWPNWAKEIGIPNGATQDELQGIIEAAAAK